MTRLIKSMWWYFFCVCVCVYLHIQNRPTFSFLTVTSVTSYNRVVQCIISFTFPQETIKVVQPVLLGKLIEYFEEVGSGDPTALYKAYGYAAGLSLCTMGLAVMHHLYFYYVQRAGMKIRVAMCHIIYKKVRAVCKHSFSEVTFFYSIQLLSPLLALHSPRTLWWGSGGVVFLCCPGSLTWK